MNTKRGVIATPTQSARNFQDRILANHKMHGTAMIAATDRKPNIRLKRIQKMFIRRFSIPPTPALTPFDRMPGGLHLLGVEDEVGGVLFCRSR